MRECNSKKINKFLVLFGILICLSIMFSNRKLLLAAENETPQIGLTLNYAPGKGDFSIYRVADCSENGQYVLSGSFDRYKDEIELNNLDSEEMRAAAETLAAWAGRDEIDAVLTGSTDDNGIISWNVLQEGLYLVKGVQTKDDTYVYTPMPFLAVLPGESESGEIVNHPVVSVKYDVDKLNEEETEVRKVMKIWQDAGHEEERPEKIEIQLLQNDKVFETVTLNKDNNWQYIWEELPTGYQWSALEKEVPDFYTMTSEINGKSIVIKNTYKAGTSNSGSSSSSDGGSSSGSISSSGKSSSTIPQTGQLWWPVMVLAVLGILCFAIGWMRHKEAEQ